MTKSFNGTLDVTVDFLDETLFFSGAGVERRAPKCLLPVNSILQVLIALLRCKKRWSWALRPVRNILSTASRSRATRAGVVVWSDSRAVYLSSTASCRMATSSFYLDAILLSSTITPALCRGRFFLFMSRADLRISRGLDTTTSWPHRNVQPLSRT